MLPLDLARGRGELHEGAVEVLLLAWLGIGLGLGIGLRLGLTLTYP